MQSGTNAITKIHLIIEMFINNPYIRIKYTSKYTQCFKKQKPLRIFLCEEKLCHRKKSKLTFFIGKINHEQNIYKNNFFICQINAQIK